MNNTTKGIIKIRGLNSHSIGLTFPADLVKEFEIEKGLYKYYFEKNLDDEEIIIKLNKVFKEKNKNDI